MAQNTVRTGIDQYVVHGVETTYGVKASTITSSFNFLQSFGANLSRGLIRIKGISGNLPSANTEITSRDTQRLIRGKFEATANVSFNPVNFEFMEYVLGTQSGSGTVSAPYNYPQATASATADKKNYLKLPSLTLVSNYYFGGSGDAADKAWEFLGWKVNSGTISGTVGEAVNVSLDGPFANLGGNPTLTAPVALPTQDPYHFIDASFDYPTGAPVNNIVESFELGITNGIEMLYGLGTDSGKEAKEKEREFSLKVNMTREGTEFMDDFMGSAASLGIPTEIASITVTLQKDATHIVKLICLQCKVSENPIQEDYPNVSKENITLIPKVVYVTEVQTA